MIFRWKVINKNKNHPSNNPPSKHPSESVTKQPKHLRIREFSSRDVTGRDTVKTTPSRAMVRTQIVTKRGQKLATTHAQKIGFCVAKNRLASELGRKPETINKWAKWIEKACPDFAKCQLAMWEKFPDKTPWHPFQVYVLRDVNLVQFRGKNPKANLTGQQIKDFVKSRNYSFKQFTESLM